jgi:hypothetical protein
MEEQVQSILPHERLMVLSSGLSVPLVDDTRQFTSSVRFCKACEIPPKTEMAVLVTTDWEGLSLLKPLYVNERLLYASKWCLVLTRSWLLLSSPHHKLRWYFYLYAARYYCWYWFSVLLLNDDVDEKRDRQKEKPMDEVPVVLPPGPM